MATAVIIAIVKVDSAGRATDEPGIVSVSLSV